MNLDLNIELEDFYNDYEEDKNKKNFKLLIDSWDGLDSIELGLETFNINPVLNTDEPLMEIDIKKELKGNKNNLF